MYAKSQFLGRVANISISKKRASFNIGVTDRQDNTHWYSIVAFGSHVKLIEDHVPVGRLVLIDCRPNTRTWTDDRKPRKTVEFILEQLVLLPRSTMPASHAEAGKHADMPPVDADLSQAAYEDERPEREPGMA